MGQDTTVSVWDVCVCGVCSCDIQHGGMKHTRKQASTPRPSPHKEKRKQHFGLCCPQASLSRLHIGVRLPQPARVRVQLSMDSACMNETLYWPIDSSNDIDKSGKQVSNFQREFAVGCIKL